MKNLAIAAVLVCALPFGSMADKPRVGRAAMRGMEESLDNKLQKLWPDDPVQVVGLTQGVYITGYGAVFMSEVNLAPGTGITPFHQTVTADEVKRIHEKKMARLAKLRDTMTNMLLGSAKSLDTVPAEEQIALGISLFYWNWEDRSGLPAQIVMHASKRLMLQAKSGAAGKSFITTEEF